MNTTVLGARCAIKNFPISRKHANYAFKYMGIHLDRSRSCQDLQIESALCDWNNPDPNLDHANHLATLCLVLDPKYQLSRPFVWSRFWIWL